MVFHRLRKLVDTDNGLMTEIRWKGLPEFDNFLKPLQKLYEYVPVLFKKVLARKNTPADLANKVRLLLHL